MQLTNDITVISCNTKNGFKDVFDAIKKDSPKYSQCIIGNSLFNVNKHTDIATSIAVALHQLTYGNHISFVELNHVNSDKHFDTIKQSIEKTIKGTKTKVVIFTTQKYNLGKNSYIIYYDK